jgi:hypothetical protein
MCNSAKSFPQVMHMNVLFSLFAFLNGRTCVCMCVCIYVGACLWREGEMERERKGGRDKGRGAEHLT